MFVFIVPVLVRITGSMCVWRRVRPSVCACASACCAVGVGVGVHMLVCVCVCVFELEFVSMCDVSLFACALVCSCAYDRVCVCVFVCGVSLCKRVCIINGSEPMPNDRRTL
jgi:hypothetical protein